MDLSRFLEQADRELQHAGVPIPFRVVQAASRLPRLIGRPISLSSEVMVRTQEWFEKRYGDRPKYPVRMGRIPALIHGDLVVLEMIPRLGKPDPNGAAAPAFDWGINAGPNFYDTLHEPDKEQIRDLLDMGWVCFSELCPFVADRVLTKPVTDDLDIALDELTRSEGPRLGLSKWASQQTAEKSLKEFIRQIGRQDPGRRHGIHRLHDLAVAAGLPSLAGRAFPEGDLLDLAECSSGARYGEVAVSLPECVGAYYAALTIAWVVAARMRFLAGKSNWLSLEPERAGVFVMRRVCEAAGIPFGGITP
jgi:hypothetical protein